MSGPTFQDIEDPKPALAASKTAPATCAADLKKAIDGAREIARGRIGALEARIEADQKELAELYAIVNEPRDEDIRAKKKTKAKPGDVRGAVLAKINALPVDVRVTAEELASSLGANGSSISSALSKLAAAGEIEKRGRGKYARKGSGADA